jgi:hypothetical protein
VLLQQRSSTSQQEGVLEPDAAAADGRRYSHGSVASSSAASVSGAGTNASGSANVGGGAGSSGNAPQHKRSASGGIFRLFSRGGGSTADGGNGSASGSMS